jgi:hypothetical protein
MGFASCFEDNEEAVAEARALGRKAGRPVASCKRKRGNKPKLHKDRAGPARERYWRSDSNQPGQDATEQQQKRPLILGRSRLRKLVETMPVHQRLPNGRSKTVTVEVREKTIGPGRE